MGSKVNSQQALVHWPREITKGQLGQKTMKFGQIQQVRSGKFGQVWTSLGKLGQVWTSLDQGIKWQNQNKTERIRKGKQKFEW